MAFVARDTAKVSRQAGEIHVRDNDEAVTQRIVDRIRVRNTSGLVEVYKRALRIGASPPYARYRGSASSGTTNSVSIGLSGGTPPYSYAWTLSDADGLITITNPTAATTAFYCSSIAGVANALATCVVTDATGLTASVQITVSFSTGGTQ